MKGHFTKHQPSNYIFAKHYLLTDDGSFHQKSKHQKITFYSFYKAVEIAQYSCTCPSWLSISITTGIEKPKLLFFDCRHDMNQAEVCVQCVEKLECKKSSNNYSCAPLSLTRASFSNRKLKLHNFLLPSAFFLRLGLYLNFVWIRQQRFDIIVCSFF